MANSENILIKQYMLGRLVCWVRAHRL